MPSERNDHLIAACVHADTKARFRALAAGYGLTESALLKTLIDRAIEVHPPAVSEEPVIVHRAARAERLYVRLYRDDRRLLAERAAAREMPSATYLAVLARAHLRHLNPLPEAERRLFAQGVATLSAIGRNLNQIARRVNQGEAPNGPRRDDLALFLRTCTTMVLNLKSILKINQASWEAGYDTSIR
jgi:Bacterial mobilisation protein (MobC)